jgi:hypothetical protein
MAFNTDTKATPVAGATDASKEINTAAGASKHTGPVVGMSTTITDPAVGGIVAFDVKTCSFTADFTRATEPSTTVITRTTKVTKEQMAEAKKQAATVDWDALLTSGNSFSVACAHGWSVVGNNMCQTRSEVENDNGTTTITLHNDPR